MSGLLYSSVRRRETRKERGKKGVGSSGQGEGGGKPGGMGSEAGARESELRRTYCWQEMNFYDIYFKSFFPPRPLSTSAPRTLGYAGESVRSPPPSPLLAYIRGRWERSLGQIARDRLPLPSRQNNLHLNGAVSTHTSEGITVYINL